MTDRATRLRDFLLSPVISIFFGVIAVLCMLPSSWLTVVVSAAICVLMVYNIKARVLFKGRSYPFATIFMFMQMATCAIWQGSLIALYVALVLSVLYLLFQNPGETKTIFLIYLVCGLGALWLRSFLFVGVALYVPIILLRAFSLRAFVASILGLLTPLIILGGFGLLDVFTLIEDYMVSPEIGITDRWIFPASVAVFFAIVMFLPSYGYPAIQRSRNMAMLGLTAVAAALPCFDCQNIVLYLPLLNLCGAYNVGHFSATRRFGWIAALFVILASAVIYIGLI